MAEPDWNPDTGGRSLAEILREAGIESAARTARRRRPEEDDTGIRQRRAQDAAAADRAAYGRRRSDVQGSSAAPARSARPARQAPQRPTAGPSTAAIPGLRPDRRPGVPQGQPLPSAPVAPLRRQTDAAGTPQRTAARGEARPEPRATTRTAPRDEHFHTGPIPVVRPGDVDDAESEAGLDATPQESALAWLRFAGELVIALAAGVGIYFAATVLWEMIPQLALFLAPLAVTGLVAGVNLWRQRQGSEPVGGRLLAVLVFAGTLLTIAPAASLLGAA